MAEDKNLVNVEDLEVEALSDEELDAVAGGATDVASCTCCVDGAETKIVIRE